MGNLATMGLDIGTSSSKGVLVGSWTPRRAGWLPD